MKNNKENNHAMDATTKAFQAVVANITNKHCQIFFEDRMIDCVLPGALISYKNSLAVGDHVEVGINGHEHYKLINILPRKTALYRGDRRSPEEEILVAANAQYLLAIVTADYLLNQAGYLETAVIAARRSRMKIGLFISKCDLIGEKAKALLRDKLALYRILSDTVLMGSSHDINEELINAVKGKTTVVIGDRACGKTTMIYTILNGLQGYGAYEEKVPSTYGSKLHVGAQETLLIDTPGFRNFVLHKITEDERNHVFREIARLAEKCHFRNCTHVHEEGCEVVEALRTGCIKRERYDVHQKMAEMTPKTMVCEKNPPKADYRYSACTESFVCKVCGTLVVPDGAGSRHRNHCPKCLSSVHVDDKPGDRASLCNGIMEPVSVWVRQGGEWAIIHRCRLCGTFSSNRVAADDNPLLLMSIAVKPLSAPPFPLNDLATL